MTKKSLGAKTLVFPTPVFVVGTYDANGNANAMTVAWGGICSSDPPSVAISLRRTRHSYESIVQRKAFTISIPSETYAKEADHFGIASGFDSNKFETTGLTAVKSELVDAPYIGEFPLVLECRLLHTFDLGIHVQFVGEILDVKADEDVLNDKGRADVDKIRPIAFAPHTCTYHGTGKFLGAAFSIGKDL